MIARELSRPALVASLLALASQAAGQTHAAADREAFARTVREGTVAFRDRGNAIAAGYRLIGPDFPGMGEHWVNIPILMRGVLDPTTPAVLSYATIDGRVTLIGVAFAVAVPAGEDPPPFPTADAVWHFHSGSVREESFLPHRTPGTDPGRRLAVVHAWVWLDNPDGMFARDNWALPYVRAGLPVPDSLDPAAARALSLIAGNRAYYRTQFVTLSQQAVDDLTAVLADAADSAARLIALQDVVARDRGLAGVWRAVCGRVGSGCEP